MTTVLAMICIALILILLLGGREDDFPDGLE